MTSERQAELEVLARERGVDRMHASVERAMDQARAADTPAGLDMLKRAVEPAADAIAEWMVNTEAAGAGRRPTLFRLAGHCDPFLLAYLTGKVTLGLMFKPSQSGRRSTLFRTVLAIGAAVEDELRLAVFEDRAPALYETLHRSMRERGSSPDHARAVWAKSAQKAGIELPRWSRNEKAQVGLQLFDLFAEATGLFERHLLPAGPNRSQWFVRLTEKAEDWFNHRNEQAALLRPMYLPTVVPPRPWSGLRGGGYFTDALLSMPLVKRTRAAHVEELRHADLSTVLTGLNAIQETGWQVNRPVFSVMRRAWDAGLQVAAIPGREDTPIPETPLDIDVNPEAKRRWKQAAREAHEANLRERGRRIEFDRLLVTAAELEHEPAIYFPHQLDFRGRCYAVPAGLNPQGPDEARALITFAEAKPCDDAARRWLCIHGSNVFGYDKVSLDARAEWGLGHMERALATAADPMRDLWWTEADKPWSFLAWCLEMDRVFRGDGMSSLPIALDGSCNGLQHFSAMLRDPIGGAAVNLVPADEPQDIYQRVADRVNEHLAVEARIIGSEFAWIARGWLDFGIDRKVTKRPVMVLPYGGTRMACLNYVRDAVRERLRAGAENPFGDQLSRAEVFLSGVVWRAIGDIVVAARQAMDWLQEVARIAASVDMPLTWTTPSGFVAHQAYPNMELRRIKTRSRGELVRLADYVEGRTLDRKKQALGISPNFVHSLDAAAMMLTIRSGLAAGITQFAMIHDSYGTHAADTERLSHVLRAAFVGMYRDHDVLSEFHAELLARLPEAVHPFVPPPPPKGALDIEAVQQSVYFFA